MSNLLSVQVPRKSYHKPYEFINLKDSEKLTLCPAAISNFSCKSMSIKAILRTQYGEHIY